MQGKVEICGVNIATLPRLTAAETRALLERARGGDVEAREELISGNLRLVLSVVQRFAGRGESMDDLFLVGCIGLIKAIDCFDLGQSVQFSSCDVPAIMGWRFKEALSHDRKTGTGTGRSDPGLDRGSRSSPTYRRNWQFRCALDVFGVGVCVYGKHFTSKIELVDMVEKYIRYYSNHRAQRNLGILTPIEEYNLYFTA